MCFKSITKLMTLTCASMFAWSVSASILSPEQALERALPTARKISPAAGQELKLTYTEKIPVSDMPAVYVFSRKGHYLVVSASDKSDAVLGYADAAFNPDNIPPSLDWWLEQYARQIEAAELYSTDTKAPLKINRTAIKPMVQTSWNQDEPYNNLCPVISGSRSMTGCVATAMAQVMKYHNWPVTGTGSNSYRQGLKNISFNFGETTFDWANMLDYYNGNETDEQKNAVATLMYGAGVSVNMNYSPSASGALDIRIQSGLVNYLNYDKGIYYLKRDNYTSSEWDDIIYNQLVEYGPVLYSGVSNEGGHEFVCDGYDSDGFFHINWGWGGISDGYFRLSALDPGQQGIGGSSSAYNYDQAVVCNICKPRQDPESEVLPNIILSGDMTLPETGRTGGAILIKGNFINYSYVPFQGTFGLKSVNEENGSVSYSPGSNTGNSGLPTLSYFSQYTSYLPSVLRGSFIISPAVRDANGNWHDIPGHINAVTSYRATVSGGRFTFTPISGGSIEIKELELETSLYAGQEFKLKGTAINTGEKEYNSIIMPALLNSSDEIIAYGNNLTVNLAVGESKVIEYAGSMENYTAGEPPAGEYRMCFVNSNSRVIVSDIITVELKKASAPRLRINSFILEGDNNDANAADLHFKVTVSSLGGYFGGRLTLAIFSSDGEYSVAMAEGEHIFLSALRSTTFEVKCSIPHPTIGGTYIAAIYNGETQLSGNLLYFVVGRNDTNSIDTPETTDFRAYPIPTDGTVYFSEKVLEAEIYSMSGALMQSTENAAEIDIESLPAGIYLLRASTESNPTEPVVKRIIKK